MKYKSYILVLVQLLTLSAWAQTGPESNFDLTLWSNPRSEIKSMDELNVGYCTEPVVNRAHQRKGIRKCTDGSVSFTQPDSTGINGWEGKCGQTAAANLVYSYCKMALHPILDMDNYFRDVGPGITPMTLKGGLNEIFSKSGHLCPKVGEWRRKAYGNASSYIANISKALNVNIPSANKLNRKRSDGRFVQRTPVAVLIYSGGGTLHWITVIDMVKKANDCRVVYQEYGLQKEVKCSELTYSSSQVGLYYGPILSSYTVIEYQI